jgi:hypothetical protein
VENDREGEAGEALGRPEGIEEQMHRHAGLFVGCEGIVEKKVSAPRLLHPRPVDAHVVRVDIEAGIHPVALYQ